jgi:hypothetical protein
MTDFKYHPALLAPYLALDQGGKVQAECVLLCCQIFYPIANALFIDVWIDGDGGLRSKTTVRTKFRLACSV